MKKEHGRSRLFLTALGVLIVVWIGILQAHSSADDFLPATSVSLDGGKIAWGSESGVYYWDGASYVQIGGRSLTDGFSAVPGFIATSEYSPTTSVSLDGGKIAWGSESGVYYWDGTSYTQIGGYTETTGFTPAPGFVPSSEYSPATSVSLDGGKIAWGSASGIYYWDGGSHMQISGRGLADGFSPAPGFIATSDYSPTTSASLDGGKVAWGSSSGVYYWDGSFSTQITGRSVTDGFFEPPGFIAASDYSPATSASLDGGKVAWGSSSGVYYWDGASYTQIGGRSSAEGFSPASGFVASIEFAPATSVSLDDDKVAWGSASGVYHWDRGSDAPFTQIGGYILSTGFSPAPGFVGESDFSAATSVSLDGGKIGWGSASGVYYWDGASITEVSHLVDGVKKGDVNGDGNVDLADAVLTLQILVGLGSSGPVRPEADVSGNGEIGLEEVMFIIQKLAGLRQ